MTRPVTIRIDIHDSEGGTVMVGIPALCMLMWLQGRFRLQVVDPPCMKESRR